MRISPFELFVDSSRGQGRIKFVQNEKLRKVFRNLVDDLRKEGMKMWEISKSVELPYYEFHRCLNGQRMPIVVADKLIKIWEERTSKSSSKIKDKIISNSEYISHGAGNTYSRIKLPKKISESLCKIAGAIVADGHLRHNRLESEFLEYGIVIRDQFKDSLDLFSDWMQENFGIILKPKYQEDQNHWYVSFGNKMIFMIFNKLFEIPFGKKSDKVRLPKILENSLKFRGAFVGGVLMFDGGVDHRTGYFDFTTKSKFLVKDVRNIISEFNATPDYFSDKIDPKSGVCKLRIRNKNKLKVLRDKFIEKNTTKWFQLELHLNGLKEQNDLKGLIDKLNSVFPRVGRGLTFEDVINIVRKNKAVTSEKLQELADRRKTVVNEYLEKMGSWNILVSNRDGLKKVWSLNTKLKGG